MNMIVSRTSAKRTDGYFKPDH